MFDAVDRPGSLWQYAISIFSFFFWLERTLGASHRLGDNRYKAVAILAQYRVASPHL
ncbi:hypothetical protein LguiB_035970 [Lonicera macranthoides]